MIVECPKCSARYRVDDEVVHKEPTFECSRCHNLFVHKTPGPETSATHPAQGGGPAPDGELEPPDDLSANDRGGPPRKPATEVDPDPEPPAPARAPLRPALSVVPRTRAEPRLPEPIRIAPPKPAAETLSFDFAGAPTRPEPAGEDHDEEGAEISLTSHNAGEPDLPDHDHGDDEYRLGDDDEEEADQIEIDRARPGEPEENRLSRIASRPEPNADRQSALRFPVLVFLGVLLASYLNVAFYLHRNSEMAETTLSRVPIAGRLLTENRLLTSRVYLRDVEGIRQRIKDGSDVFIVSGRAVNTADAPLRGVEIESELYDSTGSSVATKSIYCGNAMSLKIVKDLSSKEISILQRLQPPRRFEIEPGETAGFSVVFLEPPADLREFSARVAAAQAAGA